MKNEDDGAFPVWPRPRQMRFLGKGLSPARPLRLETYGAEEWLATEAARVADVVNRAAGGGAVVTRGGGPPLLVTSMDTLPARPGLPRVLHGEGYVLSVTEKGVTLAGRDAAGVYYGGQTLAQLLRAQGGLRVPGVRVRDWPKFRFRGTHVYMPPRRQLEFFGRFLDFLAACKINVLILEFGGGMEYERHPEINEAWRSFSKEAMAYDPAKDPHRRSMSSPRQKHKLGLDDAPHPTGPCALQISRYFLKDSIHPELGGGDCLTKDEVRRIARLCAERHIEIVPEVQSLSHSYYLCCAHPEIAERKDDPWPDSYCPSNPETYRILFDVMEEVIEVVRPRMMHIGHDEAYTIGVCPKCRKRSGRDILAGDVNKIRDFLAERGIRTVMWGDKLMNVPRKGNWIGSGGSARRAADPVTGKEWRMPATWPAIRDVAKDMLIMDWFYGVDPNSERYFQEHGLKMVYGNFSPLGFKDWGRRSAGAGVLGAEMSSWCEVSPEAFGHNNVFYQFLPGSDMLWGGRCMPREKACRLIVERATPAVEAMTGQRRWLVSGGAGRLRGVDLRPAAGPLPPSLAGKMRSGAQVSTALGWGSFRLMTDGRGVLKRAVVLDRARPVADGIPIGGRFDRLIVLQGTTMHEVYYRPTYYSYHRGPAVLVEYRVRYADGGEEEFRSIFGEDVGRIAGPWPTGRGGWCYRAVPVPLGRGHTLFAQEWVNPRPGVVVQGVSVRLGPDATEKGEVILAAMAFVAP